MDKQLILQDCSVHLSGQLILDSISFSLDGPGLYCIIGANGAGKTTLLRQICGLQEHGRGSISFAGQDLNQLNGRRRAELISYVPQIADDDIPLRVREALEVAALANPSGSADPAAVMQQLELESLAERQLSQLSGGELKRAMIAQALVQDTAIMLLDEPTAHLDPPTRLQIMELLRRIAAGQGKTVIASLHYPDLAAQYATQVLLLRDGKLLGSGDPQGLTTPAMLEELYGSPGYLQEEVLT